MSISAPEPARDAVPALRVASLSAWYGELRAVYDCSLEVAPGEILAIIGANGAGKSTLLRALVGLMSHGLRSHVRGSIEFIGRRIERLTPEQIVDAGIALVPEGRRLFGRMTVEDNLLAGAYLPRCRPQAVRRIEEIYSLFPRLRERRRQPVSEMSGGEQQMVAIGRALMSSPRLVLFDELSLGLAPVAVEEIYRKLREINAQGVSCIIVEQDLKRALAACSRFCVMLEGSIVLEGRPGDVPESAITTAYFGSGESQESAHV